ncbi:hypothetical protein D9757_002283 [Collybiopsis confluens]|uniref:Chitin synthase N-terminal domain-containing protein n=1 Tax=Collybiopsis confluens TaxID=2823264 RepID=A0A8H5MFE2_9AGAR|nr:hypothetical protein D9757_002283 [Collybiopsis confluens]
MAYPYQNQNHDPYYSPQQGHGHFNSSSAYLNQGGQYHDNNNQSSYENWETKSSYAGSHYGSEAHLNPYDMNQPVPDVPSMPYGVQNNFGNYPPPRPGVYHAQSTGAYSVARDKVLKGRSVKQVELFQGNLVLDVPVSSHIIPAGRHDIEEFSKMRYTAATCDPDDFMKSRYSLRQYLSGRHTELFIVMTMYNEDEVLFTKTMNASVLSFALTSLPL